MENIENNPYPWIHEYNITIAKKDKLSTFTYTLHSDYRSGKDKRAITELKHRLTFCYNGFMIKQIHHKPKKTRANKYLFINKKEK